MKNTKRLLMGTNLKMYKGIRETADFLKLLVANTADLLNEVTLFVLPSYTSLPIAASTVQHGEVLLGAQNMHPEEKGQFTGEISPIMLLELGLSMVMIGHSERRHVFGETDSMENPKVLSALNHNLTALLCVGETASQKEYGIADEVLSQQLKIALQGVERKQLDKLWIAYEPVWAIGVNGVPPSAQYVQEKHLHIHKTLDVLFGENDIPVLYGGSVNPGNAEDLILQPHVDGLFTGRSAWDANKFDQLIRQVLPIWKGRQSCD